MSQEDDGFVAVIHLAIGEARLIGKDKLNVIVAGNVGSRNDCEFTPVDVAIESDGANQPARNGAANGRPVPHAVALNVVDITRTAQQFVDPFLSGNGGANDAGFRMGAHGWKTFGSAHRLRDILQRSCLEAKRAIANSAGELGQRTREHMNAGANPLRRRVFVRPVTHPAAAGNEEHSHRRNARHEQRIVVSAADHFLVALSGSDGRLFQRRKNNPIACGGRIGID
jgi:hypothetical protein